METVTSSKLLNMNNETSKQKHIVHSTAHLMHDVMIYIW